MDDVSLCKLISRWLDGSIDSQEHQRLENALNESADARQIYHEFLCIHAELINRSTAEEYLDTFSATGGDSLGCDIPELTHKPISSSLPSWRWSKSSVFAAGAATLLLSLVSWSALSRLDDDSKAQLNVAVNDPVVDASLVARTTGITRTTGDSSVESQWYIAQITHMTPGVRWSDPSRSHEFLLRLRRGDRLALEAGTVEIEYFTGANITLTGPCEYVPTGAESGRLVRGNLTGHVANGDFTLTTPTAEVIDLGTAFHVDLDNYGNTDVFVIDGKVRVSNAINGASPADSKLLKKGMAARVARGQGIAALENVDVAKFAKPVPAQFSPATDELSVVGILSGLRHEGFRLAGVIAADTGMPDGHPWLRFDGPGHSVSNGYNTTSWHPFVDGVFIPTNSGSSTQIDSAGHFAELPASTGRTWGPIWSRARLEDEMSASTQADFWGTDTLQGVLERLETCQTGMIGMHTNVGLTFDLAAIAEHWSKRPVLFRTGVSNLDNSKLRTPAWAQLRFSASLRAYVDGQLRQSRINFARADGEFGFEVDLQPGDRFLTLVSSDAGSYTIGSARRKPAGDAFDHVVLIDPILSLSQRGGTETDTD